MASMCRFSRLALVSSKSNYFTTTTLPSSSLHPFSRFQSKHDYIIPRVRVRCSENKKKATPNTSQSKRVDLGLGGARTFFSRLHPADITGYVEFPLELDSPVSKVLKRKKVEDQFLFIREIECLSYTSVKFEVLINNHFVGVFHRAEEPGKEESCFSIGIEKKLKELGHQDDDHILVTLIPKSGRVKIGSISIGLEGEDNAELESAVSNGPPLWLASFFWLKHRDLKSSVKFDVVINTTLLELFSGEAKEGIDTYLPKEKVTSFTIGRQSSFKSFRLPSSTTRVEIGRRGYNELQDEYNVKFPLVMLCSPVSTVLKRNEYQSSEGVEEILLIHGIEIDGESDVKFDVIITSFTKGIQETSDGLSYLYKDDFLVTLNPRYGRVNIQGIKLYLSSARAAEAEAKTALAVAEYKRNRIF